MDSQTKTGNNGGKINKFFVSLVNELKVEKYFWIQIAASVVATLLLVVSFFFEPFYLVSSTAFMGLIFANFFIDKKNPLSGLNILMYFLSFSAVMRLSKSSSSVFAYGLVLFLGLVAIKWLIDLKNKEKNISWKLTIPFGLTIAFFLLKLLLGHYSISYCASICCGVALLYFVCIYIKNIDLKQILFALIIGMLMCCILGIFSNYYPSLSGYFANSTANGVVRYSALFPNTNAYSLSILLCIASLITLFLSKKINYIFYPVLLCLMAISLTTLSKMVLLILALMLPLLIIFNYKRHETKKSFIYSTLAIVLCAVVAICIQFSNFALILGRTLDPFKDDNVEQTEVVASKFTTGRTELWLNCLEKIFDDPTEMLFGHNRGKDYDMQQEGFRTESSPHNTYLQCAYHVGIVGSMLIGLSILAIVNKKSFKRYNRAGIVYLVTLILCLGALDNFSYVGFVFVALGVVALKGKEDEEDNGDLKCEVCLIKNKIPKTIHYIWLGGNPLPKIAEKCMESWKKFCPDYEIKRWDESNLNIDITPYCRSAYNAKKFAFASDVLRFDILNREGGIYLDIDVEIIKNIDKFLENDFFCGFESEHQVNPGIIMGSVANHKILNSTLEGYKTREFVLTSDPGKQETVCHILTSELEKFGFKPNNSLQKFDDFTVYPIEYFCPKSLTDGKIRLTKNSHAIHHFAATWVSTKNRFKTKIMQFAKRIMGPKLTSFLKGLKNKEQIKINDSSSNKVLNLLASNKYSGAENVACQIIKMFDQVEGYDFAYASPNGPIQNDLSQRGIYYIPMDKFSVSALKKAKKQYNPTTIHAHDMKAIVLASLFNRKTKIVAHIHRNHEDFHKKSIRALLLKLIARKKNLQSIIWVSDACLNDYVYKNDKNIKKKSIVLYNIINREDALQKAESQSLDCGHDIVFLGRVTDIKNPLRLIDIINQTKKQLPNISVGVFGDGDLLGECKKKAEELRLSSNIVFYGFKTDFYGHLKNSKLFILSSRTEGIPMSILEAQVFGLPTISTKINGLEQIIKSGESGFMYETDEEAVKYIVDLLTNEKEYAKMRSFTVEFSKNYNSTENYVTVMQKAYKGEI